MGYPLLIIIRTYRSKALLNGDITSLTIKGGGAGRRDDGATHIFHYHFSLCDVIFPPTVPFFLKPKSMYGCVTRW